MPNTERSLPCGCRVDGRFLCDQHDRTSIALFVVDEVRRLIIIGLFISVLAAWVEILSPAS